MMVGGGDGGGFVCLTQYHSPHFEYSSFWN